ncbi:hypothetical protein AVEN_138235-1 [Araneus ventricosus]|uniref:Uncharacterized protein n=1 Tax=Araneus ventricosus TaxID=182803 RepID=A0A4Y2IP33_ARAVE|nr:hypothetical protein AVEN_138235-1 [Araneus ventricosus]
MTIAANFRHQTLRRAEASRARILKMLPENFLSEEPEHRRHDFADLFTITLKFSSTPKKEFVHLDDGDCRVLGLGWSPSLDVLGLYCGSGPVGQLTPSEECSPDG